MSHEWTVRQALRRAFTAAPLLLYSCQPYAHPAPPITVERLFPATLPAYGQAFPEQVPVFMYHHIDHDEDRFTVSPERLWDHLDYLREHDYSLITFKEFAEQEIHAVGSGRAAVLTFDDSTQDHFRFQDDGRIDPHSAIGILERYRGAHPEYRVTATFFVNTTTQDGLPPFEQPGMTREKLHLLSERGYEIGAHGSTHSDFGEFSPYQAVHNLDVFAAVFNEYLPGYTIQSFAYPYGSIPSEQVLREVSKRYPYTAHAWGGIARSGDLHLIPRIEIGPDTDISRYAPVRWIEKQDPPITPLPRLLQRDWLDNAPSLIGACIEKLPIYARMNRVPCHPPRAITKKAYSDERPPRGTLHTLLLQSIESSTYHSSWRGCSTNLVPG